MVVCVTGMHRSGTSMIVRLLNLCGVYLGPESDLFSAAADNPEGFWENKKFLGLNEEILSFFGYSWDVIPEWKNGWQNSDHLSEIKSRAQTLVDEFAGRACWGWKDPRTSLTLPFWQTILPDMKVVVCVRNPLEVKQSLHRRGYSSTLFSFNLWQSYYKELLSSLKGKEYIVTHYESYFIDPKAELRRLLTFLQIPFDEKVLDEACHAGISPGLKHNRSIMDDLLVERPSIDVTRLYIDLCLQSGEVYWGREGLSDLSSPEDLPEMSRYGLLLRLNDMRMSYTRMNSNRLELLNIIKIKDEKLTAKDQILVSKNERIRQLQESERSLRQLEQYLIVKLLYKYRSILQRIFPPGSKIRKIYEFISKGTGILLSEGPRGIWVRVKDRIQEHRREKKQTKSKKQTATVTRAELNNDFSVIYENALAAATGRQAVQYVPAASSSISADSFDTKLIAFYLPQFHPIPENDEWWGTGFTEWANVTKAVPQFSGHYQPRLPGDLGFYDLRLPEVMESQVVLAKQYGLFGFCFYYYWFDGKRLLERPLDQFVANPNIDFPFCLCWANENWTRRWDGQENEILIGQNHSADSDFAFIRDILPYLKHKNYIKVDGHPLLIVYRPQIMPNPVETINRWKQYCREQGVGDIYVVAAQTFGLNDPRSVGCDAAVEFPPHSIVVPEVADKIKILNPDYHGKIYNYPHVVDHMIKKTVPDYTLFRTLMMAWDNTARNQNRSHIFVNTSPAAYQTWLSAAIQYSRKYLPEKQRFVFINAWNEWAEGTYLEPDKRYGYAYLQTTRDALTFSASEKIDFTSPINTGEFAFESVRKKNDTAVILHLYYPEMLGEIFSYLSNLEGKFDLFISVPENIKFEVKTVLDVYPEAHIYRCKNQGRDIGPFIKILRSIYPFNYRYVCKIHTKKTAHRENGARWRKDLYNKLMGSREVIAQAKQLLDSKRDVGALAPKGHLLPVSRFMAENEKGIQQFAKKAGFDYNPDLDFNFVAGSMFWFKPIALSMLVSMDIRDDDFGVEKGLKDGTPAHAFERFLGLLVRENHFKILEVGEDTADSPRYNFAAPMPSGVDRAVNLAPVLVYQVGKVGSRTVFTSLQRAYKKLKLDVPVHHVHVLENLDELERNIQKNFANPVDNLAYIRKSKELKQQIEDNPHQPWKVISLVRDPVSRNIGSFFQNLSEYIPDWRKKYDEGSLTLEDLQKYFLENESIHIAADWWFDKQLKPLFGIDVFESEFPFEVGYKVYKSSTSRASLLLIRLEDLDSCAQRAMYEFLGLKDFELYNTNIGDDKDYADVYRAFKKKPLPRDYILKMYNTNSARHFYSEEELSAFSNLWLSPDKSK